MKTWKISNTSNQTIKVACKTTSMSSKGIILNPGEFCIAEAQLTASLDAQERRRFVSVDREFDNSKLQLEFVKNYTEADLIQISKSIQEKEVEESKSDFEKAAENAEKYMNNKD